MKREHFSSRLGFILITAACSIGLGNIRRFPCPVFSASISGKALNRRALARASSIGKGLPYPGFARKYISYILPVIVPVIFVSGYLSLFR